MKPFDQELKPFFFLLSTQSLSQLGSGKGSGAAVTMLLLGVLGVLVCLIFGRLLRRFRFSDARP